MTPILAHLIVDTRELSRRPYQFLECTSEHVTFTREVEPLPSTGYAAHLPGHHRPRDMAMIIRKTAADLLGDVTHERARFERELTMLPHYGFSALVLECDLAALACNSGNSQMVNPGSIIGSLIAFSQRYGVHIIYANDARFAERYTFRLLERWCRDQAADEQRHSGDGGAVE